MLDKNEARPLTSREISKIISGVYGSLLEWCELSEIEYAFNHFAQHKETYMLYFKELKKQNWEVSNNNKLNQ